MTQPHDTVTAQTALTDVQAGHGPTRGSVLLGKYRVESTLGFGGMGIVVKAHNLALDENVAIKFLRDDVELGVEHVTRFLREAKAAVRLKSEHVAKIRDVGTLDTGRPYMVMELLEGLDLGKLLVDQSWLEPTRAVDFILQACDALGEAHANGIVHRDIKPTNLFVTKRRDGSDLLKVLDFGISKALSANEVSLTHTSSVLGTPTYMSPEQMRSARTVDSRTDIWALGVVLYELLEGRPPFEARSFAELCVVVSTAPPAPMVKAPHLAHVLERCLAKSITERYQDVGDLAVDLEAFAPEPLRARRQVARILRVLGKGGPASRDSTPTMASPPLRHDSAPSMEQPVQPSTSHRISATPGARVAAPPESSPVKLALLLLLLFGVGIAGGLYVTSRDTRPSQPAVEPGPAIDAGAR